MILVWYPTRQNRKAMLRLDPNTLFAKGTHRECYLHPEQPDKCIKISLPNREHQDRLEQYYYGSLSKRNVSWAMLSKSYGSVKTDRGQGYVFDLIRDYDGTISKTLKYYLSHDPTQEIPVKTLHLALSNLKNYLLSEKIILATMKTWNFVYQKQTPTQGLLIIIDNIGYHNLHFHLCEHWDWLARFRIQKKWNRFVTHLCKRNPEHKDLLQSLA